MAILAFLGFVTVRLGRMAPRPTHLQTPTDGERVERGERQLIHV